MLRMPFYHILRTKSKQTRTSIGSKLSIHKFASHKLSFTSCFKVNDFLQITFIVFSLNETLTLLKMFPQAIHCKTENKCLLYLVM